MRRSMRIDGRPRRGHAGASSARARSRSTTATTSAPRRATPAWRTPSTSRASCRRTSGRCSARARGRSAGWRCRATRRTSAAPTGRAGAVPRRTRALRAGSRWPSEQVPFQGLPARICWLGYGERARVGLRFNDLVARGEVSAPIVIGRDHLDCGLRGVAQPRDRGDAGRLRRDRRLADPQRPGQHRLRRLLGARPPRRRRRASATSLHAGMVVVADGTGAAARPLERVLTDRPGHGRHPPRRRRLRTRNRGRRRSAASASRCSSSEALGVGANAVSSGR